MVEHEVRRPGRGGVGITLRSAARGPVPQAQRPLALVHVALHERIDDVRRRSKVVDRTTAAPLFVRQQQ